MSRANLRIPTRTLIYVAVVVALIVVFVIQEFTTNDQNTLAVPKLPDDVNKITVEKGGETLTFTRPSDTDSGSGPPGPWVVGAAAYPADQTRVNGILDAMASLSSVDVLTSGGDRKAYGLVDDSRALITYIANDEDVLSVEVGDRASAGNAVYARIDDGREIVLIPGTALANLSTTVDDFRSREVTRITPADVVSLSAAGPGLQPVLATRTAPADQASTSPEASADTESTDGHEPAPEWSIASDAKVDPSAVDQVLNYLSPLRADGFLDQDPSGSAFATLTVTMTSGEVSFAFYPMDADGNYPIRASSYAYPFYVSDWRAKRLLFGLDEYFAAFSADGSS